MFTFRGIPCVYYGSEIEFKKGELIDKGYFEDKDIHFEEIIVISANKNLNMDYLLKRIKFLQTTKNVYVVGHTNAGKSTLINKLIQNYSNSDQELTMSPLPSTTLNTVQIEINEHLTLIDTPGLVDGGSILNHCDAKMVKKISPRKEIKPKTYQLRKNQSIIIGDLVRIDYVEGEKNSFTVFVSNDLSVKRLLNSSNHDDLKELNKITYQMKYDEDLAITGLGFIKIVDKCVIDVYIDKDSNYFRQLLTMEEFKILKAPYYQPALNSSNLNQPLDFNIAIKPLINGVFTNTNLDKNFYIDLFVPFKFPV